MAQALIDGAKRLAGLKPPGLSQTHVVVTVGFPDMFHSSICVFFDADALASFSDRDYEDEHWTAKPGASLVGGLGLTLPQGFIERGFDTYYRDDTLDPPWVEENETWLIGELT